MAKILVVDDEAPIREFLGMLLEELGHHVRLAINGRQADTQTYPAYLVWVE